jgi:hypothetical protein
MSGISSLPRAQTRDETHPTSNPFPKTACTPCTLLPSLITANDMFFCLLQDRTQPLSVTSSELGECSARWRAEEMEVGKEERGKVEAEKKRVDFPRRK